LFATVQALKNRKAKKTDLMSAAGVASRLLKVTFSRLDKMNEKIDLINQKIEQERKEKSEIRDWYEIIKAE